MAAALAMVLLAAACEATPGDFTADGKTDLVYYDLSGNWYQVGTAAPIYTGEPMSSSTHLVLPVAGDYTGALKWAPTELDGFTWTTSAAATPIVYDPPGMPVGPPATPAGTAFAPTTRLPVPGDYDGTGVGNGAGKMVPAYFDQVDDSWWIMGHSGGVQFGTPPTAGGSLGYSVPVPGDYDGDGKTDIAVYEPTTATFRYLSSKTGLEVDVQEGQPGDFPVPGTYDGKGVTEPAVTDWNGTTWCVAGHAGAFASLSLANVTQGWLPVQADYDGGGKTIPAAYDIGDGFWAVQGQSQVSIPAHDIPAVMPEWFLVNIARLVLFTKNLFETVGQPTSCAAS